MDFAAFGASLSGVGEAFVLVASDTRDCKVLYANSFWTALSGYPAHEAVGHPWAALMLGRLTSAEDANHLNSAVHSGQAAAVALVCYKKTGVHFCNHVVAVPLGCVRSTGHPTSVVCLMMREIQAGSTAAIQHHVHNQQLQAAAAVRTQFEQRSDRSAAVPVRLSQCSAYEQVGMEVEQSGAAPGGHGKGAAPQPPATAGHNDEFVLRAVAADDYASLRRVLVQGGDAAAHRLGKIRSLTCRVCPPNRDMSIIVMGGFTSASGSVLKELGGDGRQQGVAVQEADLLQYALCHGAFECCALLFLSGWAHRGHDSCMLVLWNGGDECIRQRMTTEDDGRSAAAAAAGSPEDGAGCALAMAEAVQAHLTCLHEEAQLAAQAQRDAQPSMGTARGEGPGSRPPLAGPGGGGAQGRGGV